MKRRGFHDGVAVRGREVLPQWSDDEAKIVFCDCHTPAIPVASEGLEARSRDTTGRDQRKENKCGQQ